jgi:hypothetical protein
MSVERAEADLAAARALVRRLETQLEDARKRVVKLEHYVEMAREYDGKPTREEPNRAPSRRSGGVSGAAVRAVLDILREAGRPMMTRDLVEELTKRGVPIPGDPARVVVNLSGYLSREKAVRSDRAHGWSLAETGDASTSEDRKAHSPDLT